MPTVLRIGPYRFHFYSNEEGEPVHIHVRSADGEAKFWLNPVELAYNYGYRDREIKKIEILVVENRTFLIEEWDEFFSRRQ